MLSTWIETTGMTRGTLSLELGSMPGTNGTMPGQNLGEHGMSEDNQKKINELQEKLNALHEDYIILNAKHIVLNAKHIKQAGLREKAEAVIAAYKHACDKVAVADWGLLEHADTLREKYENDSRRSQE